MAAASRCHMSTLRLQFVSTRGAFSYATFLCLPGCLPARLPACLCACSTRNQSYASVAAKNEIDKENSKKRGSKMGQKKERKKKNETENKAGKVCNAIFFIDFHVRLLGFVSEWVCAYE